jgi:hypothetical protein
MPHRQSHTTGSAEAPQLTMSSVKSGFPIILSIAEHGMLFAVESSESVCPLNATDIEPETQRQDFYGYRRQPNIAADQGMSKR